MTTSIDIEKIISDLLHNNDCVIVPGFGGFVTVYKPATILPKQNVMLPPSREIGFNKKLINNDGLLANEIAHKNGLTFEKSLAEIQNRVAFYQSELSRVKRLEISNIGVLYIDKDGNYRFLPDESKNFLKKSFGLNKIYLDKIETKKNTFQEETKIIPLSKNTDSVEKKPFVWKKVAGFAAMALFLLGGYWLGSKLDNSNTSLAMLNPFGEKEKMVKAEYQKNTEHASWPKNQQDKKLDLGELIDKSTDESIKYSFDGETVAEEGIVIRTEKINAETKGIKEVTEEMLETNVETAEVAKEPAISVESINSDFNFYIVAGAFQERTNADILVNKLKRKGFNAHVFDKKKGLNYVCFDGYSTKSEAKADLARVKKITPSAWVKAK